MFLLNTYMHIAISQEHVSMMNLPLSIPSADIMHHDAYQKLHAFIAVVMEHCHIALIAHICPVQVQLPDSAAIRCTFWSV